MAVIPEAAARHIINVLVKRHPGVRLNITQVFDKILIKTVYFSPSGVPAYFDSGVKYAAQKGWIKELSNGIDLMLTDAGVAEVGRLMNRGKLYLYIRLFRQNFCGPGHPPK